MSETNLQDLYQSILIQHSKSPSHYGKFEGFTHFSEGYNALCGDAISIYLSVKEGTIEKASFESASCAICKASASILLEAIEGRVQRPFLQCKMDFQKSWKEILRVNPKLLVLRFLPFRESRSFHLERIALFCHIQLFRRH